MPTPSADPYSAYNTEKNKKKKQTNSTYVTNTVTPPPQPAPEVPQAPSAVSNYTQPVPKPDTSPQTNGYLSGAAAYNPLRLKQNNTTQKSTMDTIYNKTVTYDAVPTPKKQHGSVKPQQPKSHSYTEPKPKTNQYVSNSVNTNSTAKMYSYNSSKDYTYTQPKIYTYTTPKTDIGEYKTLGGYTNQNPYVTKDRVGNGQNSYSAQPKSQVKNDYTGVKKPTVVDELWNRYYTELAGKKETRQPQKLTKTTEPKQQNTNTVKAGKSTINIRDDGSTIHYDSDTAIDLFDFLDFLSGRYGPSNEMAESVKIAKPTAPDLVSGAAQYSSVQGKPVMKYENMVNPPSAEYQKKAAELYKEASKGINTPILKAKEMDALLDDLGLYLSNVSQLNKLRIDPGMIKAQIYGANYDEYGLNIDGGKPNSFQHIYWVACLTDVLGEEEARNFSRAHETYTVSEYADGAMYSQDDIDTDVQYGKITYNKAYPTRQQHAAMDLQNNEIGIQIALNTPTDPIEIEKELISMLGQGETLESLREQFPNHTDRQILFIKKAVQEIESGEAAIIWDYPLY